jgi:Di-haem oxidoreductase, putative peroxidase
MKRIAFSAAAALIIGAAPALADPVADAPARIVASGIPGATAVSQIGSFHPGGPIHDKASFAAFTQPSRILAPTRLFVASSSNFGAPLARPADPEGAILSLDVSGSSLDVPAAFASSGLPASALGGAVQLYSAQSSAFLNSVNNPGAVTSGLPGASLPLGISINDGFGRIWIANAPAGSFGAGTITILDPSGAPLAGAPDHTAGGVFTGDLTNRNASTTHGITAAAVATALVTKSPDGSGRAVFFAALADGSIVQIQTEKGVDGLVPAGTFTPIAGITPDAVESANRGTVTRVGLLFNWVPRPILYVSDPVKNQILAFDITDDGIKFVASAPRYLSARAFDLPVDMAPAVPEVASGNFASNTTFGGGSDLYVLNRGNNTVVRMTQDGRVLAVRAIAPEVGIDGLRASGIGASADGRTIWVTATAPGRQGFVLQMDAFGAPLLTTDMMNHARSKGAQDITAAGADVFATQLQPVQLLGPLFNAQSCKDCHAAPFDGGMGVTPGTMEVRAGRIDHGRVTSVHFGPVVRQHSIAEFGFECGLPTGVPPEANITSVRSAMTLRGTALIDNILARDILAAQAAEPVSVRGRASVLPDGRIGKFGWKGQVPTLVEFMGEAFLAEMGITNPLAPKDEVSGCGANLVKPEMDALPLQAVTAFLNTVDPPAPTSFCLAKPGAATFQAVGCAQCHTPSMPSEGKRAQLYSDLLLHDMGPDLGDGFPQGTASGDEFRTMPLWRVSDRAHFLHDGRATSLEGAIRAHGGQAAPSVQQFEGLGSTDKQALLDFLNCI